MIYKYIIYFSQYNDYLVSLCQKANENIKIGITFQTLNKKQSASYMAYKKTI